MQYKYRKFYIKINLVKWLIYDCVIVIYDEYGQQFFL